MVKTLPRQNSEGIYTDSHRPGSNASHYADARSLRAQQRNSSSRQASLEAALKNSDEHTIQDNLENQRRLSKPELRQFSREPTVIHLHNKSKSTHELPQGMSQEDFRHYLINDVRDGDPPARHRGKVLETSINGDRSPMSPPRKSHSSNSPEWPPPPDPITPISPDVPTQTAFDSTTLKRMLRSLPDSRSDGGGGGNDNNHQEPTSTSSSPIHGNEPEYSQHIAPKSQMDLSSLPHTQGRPPIPGNKPQRYPLETDLPYHPTSKVRDNYPDSGVSGMTNDTAGSVRSGGSGKSKGSHKSSTLPHGKYIISNNV